MPKVIDVHTTFYPESWLNYLGTRTKSPSLERRGPHSFVMRVKDSPNAYIDRLGHFNVEARLKDMDAAGVDMQILALTIPGVEMIEREAGIEWARRVNDELAAICQKYPDRFRFHIALPMQDINACVDEIERAYKKLGAKGILLFSNADGKSVTSQEYEPIYAKAEEYGLVVNVHPASPLTQDIMREHSLSVSLYGYIFDTSTVVMSMIWKGILERHPKLKVMHSHLGGVVPYTIGRVNGCWESFSKEMGLKLNKKPSEYYQEQVWVDTISYFEPAMRCALEFMGPDHIVLGTDYAHRIGNLEDAVAWVKKFGLDEKDTNKILGENAAKIYNLK